MSIIVMEKEKKKQECKKILWPEISKILNIEGPCIKTASQWKMVNMGLQLLRL